MRRYERKSGPVWFAKYRLPDGRQVQRRIGPAWTQRGRPPEGFFSRREAEAWLADVLAAADAGAFVRSGATFADAVAEWLRYVEQDRACKPSTMRNYRNVARRHLLPAFGARPLEEITVEDVEHWRSSMTASPQTRNHHLTILHGVFRRAMKVFGLRSNPAAGVEKLRVAARTDIDVFSPDEVRALVRAATDEQDAAIYLTAAFTGLRRGELLALRWRDVDFARSTVRVRASFAAGAHTSPKSGKVRSVPLADEVARALARLGQRQRWTSEDDLVFPGELGGYLDGSALRRRYPEALDRAGLRRLRFHDLRHTFGTRMIGVADILRVKEWMGHADVQTTMRYLHYVPRAGDAALVTQAFTEEDPTAHLPTAAPLPSRLVAPASPPHTR